MEEFSPELGQELLRKKWIHALLPVVLMCILFLWLPHRLWAQTRKTLDPEPQVVMDDWPEPEENVTIDTDIQVVMDEVPLEVLISSSPSPVPDTLEKRLEQSGCPDSIRDFVLKYPETEPFALAYQENQAEDGEINVEEEVEKGEIPLFVQWDPRWGYRTYGGSYMGINGCGPTCLSMVYCGLTGETKWNPYELAAWAEKNGYYQKGVGTAWELMTYGAQSLGLKEYQVSGSESSIRSALEAGHPVICSVGPGDFTCEGHFIVLVKIDKKGMLTVRDPNSPENSRKKWEVTAVLRQARKLWGFGP